MEWVYKCFCLVVGDVRADIKSLEHATSIGGAKKTLLGESFLLFPIDSLFLNCFVLRSLLERSEPMSQWFLDAGCIDYTVSSI